jgi:hypothetical protein
MGVGQLFPLPREDAASDPEIGQRPRGEACLTLIIDRKPIDTATTFDGKLYVAFIVSNIFPNRPFMYPRNKLAP